MLLKRQIGKNTNGGVGDQYSGISCFLKVRLFVHSEDAALMIDDIQRGRKLFVHSEDAALMIDDLLQHGRIAIILEPMTIKTLFKRCTEQKKSTAN